MVAVSLAGPPAGAQTMSPGPAAPAPAAAIGVATSDSTVDAARQSARDSTEAPAAEGGKAGVVSIPSSSAPRLPRILPPPGRFDQPRWVMLRSLLVPGWGQAHNHAWIKAALLAAGDGSLRWRLLRDERRLKDLSRQAVSGGENLAAADAVVAAAQSELDAAQASGDSARIAAAQDALLAANLARLGAADVYNNVVGAYNALLNASTSRRWLAGGVIVYALLDAYVDAHFRAFDVDFQVDPALPGDGKTPGARLQLRWRF
jgi:hypothetical protein